MFALLKRFIEFVRELQNNSERDSMQTLFLKATRAISDYIELSTDVIGWINDNLEELKEKGASEVRVIDGEALAMFIVNNKNHHQYMDLLPKDLEALHDGVVLVAMNGSGSILHDQLILSSKGLSEEAKEQFKGYPIILIKIQ